MKELSDLTREELINLIDSKKFRDIQIREEFYKLRKTMRVADTLEKLSTIKWQGIFLSISSIDLIVYPRKSREKKPVSVFTSKINDDLKASKN